MKVAIDYNAPLLTLAAMHVMNDSNDPFYTSLQAGAYHKLNGHPCDAAYPCHHLSKGVKITLAVVITVVGLILIALLGWWFGIIRRKRAVKRAASKQS